MSTNVQSFRLPNCLSRWPYPRRLNPHYFEVNPESVAWLEGFSAFSPRAQKIFNACNFNLLTSLAFPQLSKDRLRTACDLMSMFFLYDELTDHESEKGASEIADIIMDALRHPQKLRPSHESIMGEIVRESWSRAIPGVPIESQQRFIDAMVCHTNAMTEQADDRSRNYLPMRSIQSYLEVRRHTMGARPAFTFLAFDYDIPSEILDSDVICALETWATDLLILSNDLYSYPKEHADGDDGHNIITIVMNELGVDLGGAIKWADEYQASLVHNFTSAVKRLPSFGAHIDSQLSEYIDGIGSFVRGHDAWCFESERYFGKSGKAVQRHRWVTLPPHRRDNNQL